MLQPHLRRGIGDIAPAPSRSTARGMPVFTLQKAQARVQVSPRIITVACFFDQHSPMFGQAASSHTVVRLFDAHQRARRGEAGARSAP